MRSNASASPCCALRIASASVSSPVSIRLVRATGPVGAHPLVMRCDPFPLSCLYCDGTLAGNPLAAPRGFAGLRGRHTRYLGGRQFLREGCWLAPRRARRGNMAGSAESRRLRNASHMFVRQDAKKGFKHDHNLAQSSIKVVMQYFEPSHCSARNRCCRQRFRRGNLTCSSPNPAKTCSSASSLRNNRVRARKTTINAVDSNGHLLRLFAAKELRPVTERRWASWSAGGCARRANGASPRNRFDKRSNKSAKMPLLLSREPACPAGITLKASFERDAQYHVRNFEFVGRGDE